MDIILQGKEIVELIKRYYTSMLNENAIAVVSFTSEETKKHEYVTYSESRTAQKEDLLNYFETDKLLKKAVRFSSGVEASIVDKLKNAVIPVMDNRIAEANEIDNAVESEIEKTVTEIYQALLERTQKIVDDKADKYERLVADFNAGNLNMSVGQIKRAFLSMGNYKDAPAYAAKLDAAISERETKIKALQDEKREIMNSFRDLGLFSGKKRSELEKRLKEVNAEIENIESAIKTDN